MLFDRKSGICQSGSSNDISQIKKK